MYREYDDCRVVGNAIVLESANPDQAGTFYFIPFHAVESWYRSVQPDAVKTVVFLTTGRTYDVKASPEQIARAFDESVE